MGLKLFRSTDFSSILMAGETRLPMHPGWMIVAASLWAGFASDVALWRELGEGRLLHALAFAGFVSGACAIVLSLFGWRKTIKPVATLILFAAALVASSIWSEALPVDSSLLERHLSSLIFPSWAMLFRWQFWAILGGLALAPSIWVWNTGLRRLPRSEQLSVNAIGVLAGALVLTVSAWLLSHM